MHVTDQSRLHSLGAWLVCINPHRRAHARERIRARVAASLTPACTLALVKIPIRARPRAPPCFAPIITPTHPHATLLRSPRAMRLAPELGVIAGMVSPVLAAGRLLF